MPSTPASAEGLTVGEFARRVGVSSHVLRAWERRYGLIQPRRSAGGYRVYGPESEQRVAAVLAARRAGLTTARAVAQVLSRERALVAGAPGDSLAAEADAIPDIRAADLDPAIREFLQATMMFDEGRAHQVLDRALRASVESAIAGFVLPLLVRIGEDWEHGRLDVAHEHFATHVIRRRLSVLCLSWDGPGPTVILACPSGERHDLALLCFGVCLGRAGYRVRFLGADTPLESLDSIIQRSGPAAVVLSAVQPEVFRTQAPGVRRLRRQARVFLAGPGAAPALARRLGCDVLPGDPVAASAQLRAELKLGTP